MLFDRRAKKRNPDSPERREYRQVLPPDHPLRMQLVRANGEVIDVLPVDVTARGAGFRTWPDVEFAKDEVFEVVVASETDGWNVCTPAIIRHRENDGDAVDWGLEFVNLGNLYGQWDNALGRYLNRRKQVRVAPELDRKIPIDIRKGDLTTTGVLHDLSPKGLGVAVRHSEAKGIEREDAIQVSFRLPRSRRHLTGTVEIRQIRNVGAQSFLGGEFDLSDPAGFAAHTRQISAYCEKRAKALSDWERGWQGAV